VHDPGGGKRPEGLIEEGYRVHPMYERERATERDVGKIAFPAGEIDLSCYHVLQSDQARPVNAEDDDIPGIPGFLHAEPAVARVYPGSHLSPQGLDRRRE